MLRAMLRDRSRGDWGGVVGGGPRDVRGLGSPVTLTPWMGRRYSEGAVVVVVQVVQKWG